MIIDDNAKFIEEIAKYLTDKLPIKLGVNKKNELVRLVYEISRARDLSVSEVISKCDIEKIIEDGPGELFHKVKNALIKERYPSVSSSDDLHIMPVKIGVSRDECDLWDLGLEPKAIYIEESIRDVDWTKTFVGNFPGVEIVPLEDAKNAFSSLLKKDPIDVYNSRRENIFLIENKAAFTKICPCTKGCVRCGYWVLNIGFGCPIDCSYCYLQNYSNVPGIMLPANIEDYYEYIRQMDKVIVGRTRIGTGEFTDSLALDKYTGYSSRLIPFFKDTRNLVLELKTKVSEIDNVLEQDAHDNVVISWSINTRRISESYEKGAADMSSRIKAAQRAAQKGYRVGFHFDPIVYYLGWEDEYKAIVKEIFSCNEIKRNTAWISLGTLRYTPGLKQTAEMRFSDNQMFYEGEFMEDVDGKLRYPRKVRIDIYNKMIDWIKSFNALCWVYLCMEQKEVWSAVDIDSGTVLKHAKK